MCFTVQLSRFFAFVVLATAYLDYHIFNALSRTFFIFFKSVFWLCFRSFEASGPDLSLSCLRLSWLPLCLCCLPDSLFIIPHGFWIVNKFFYFSEQFFWGCYSSRSHRQGRREYPLPVYCKASSIYSVPFSHLFSVIEHQISFKSIRKESSLCSYWSSVTPSPARLIQSHYEHFLPRHVWRTDRKPFKMESIWEYTLWIHVRNSMIQHHCER